MSIEQGKNLSPDISSESKGGSRFSAKELLLPIIKERHGYETKIFEIKKQAFNLAREIWFEVTGEAVEDFGERGLPSKLKYHQISFRLKSDELDEYKRDPKKFPIIRFEGSTFVVGLELKEKQGLQGISFFIENEKEDGYRITFYHFGEEAEDWDVYGGRYFQDFRRQMEKDLKNKLNRLSFFLQGIELIDHYRNRLRPEKKFSFRPEKKF